MHWSIHAAADEINTSSIRRHSRALCVNMKHTSEKVLSPRASRCDCPSCPSRSRVLSAHLFALVDLGHAAREDVNDSLFGKRRAGQSHHWDDGLFFLSIPPTGLRKAHKSVGHVPTPSKFSYDSQHAHPLTCWASA